MTWASTSIILAALSRRIGPLPLSALRASWGSLFFLVALIPVALSGGLGGLSLGRGLSLAGSGVATLALADTMYISSLGLIGAARAVPISSSSYPLLTFALAAALLHEEVTWTMALGAVFIAVGILLVGSPGGQRAASGSPKLTLGVALALASGMAWAISTVWLRVAAPAEVNAVAAGALRLPTAAAVLLLVASRRPGGLQLPALGRRGLFLTAAAGLVGSGVGSLLYIVAVQEAGAGKAAVLSSTAPLFVLPLAPLLLAERLNRRVVTGTLLATSGIFLVA